MFELIKLINDTMDKFVGFLIFCLLVLGGIVLAICLWP